MTERIYFGVVAAIVFLFVYLALASGETSFGFLMDAVVFDTMFWPFLFVLVPTPFLAIKYLRKISDHGLTNVMRGVVYAAASILLIVAGYYFLIGALLAVAFIGG